MRRLVSYRQTKFYRTRHLPYRKKQGGWFRLDFMFENVCLLHLLHHKDSKHERNIPMYVARVQSAVLFSHATILPQSPKPDRRSVATKVVTIDVRESAGGKEFGNRVDSRAATAAAATDSVTDTCRE